MRHNHPLISCLDPKYKKNPYTGELMLCGCGQCEACLRAKSAMLTTKVKLESLKHKYKFFITLTYDPEFLPIMKGVEVPNNVGYTYNMVSCCTRLKEDDDVLCDNINYSKKQLFILSKKCNIGINQFGYGSKYELQLFLKRLRKVLHTNKRLLHIKDEKIRYFATMEYGPNTFRPHYHLILWFDDRQIAEAMPFLVSESWKFGITDVQSIEHDCASYVASYVNSLSDLPEIFRKGKCKPFVTHSQFLGEEYSLSDAEKVYQMPVEDFVKRSFKCDDSVSDYILWRSAQNRFYPKCRAFTTSSSDERKRLYTCYDAFRTRNETHRKPFQLAKELIEHFINDHTGYPLEHFYKKEAEEVKNWYDTIIYYEMALSLGDLCDEAYIKVIEDARQNIVTIQNRIYFDLRTSKQFLEVVCNSTHPTEIDTKLKMIESFYTRTDIMRLNRQYQVMYEMLSNYEIEIEELKWFYDDYIDDDLGNYFDSNLYLRHKSHVIQSAQEHKKHKLQNDANGYWLKQHNL